MKAYKETVRTYYKYVYDAFSQPVLSANGTIGENAFAVEPSAQLSGYEGYKAFDDTTSTFWAPVSATNPAGQYIIIYNPNELNITSIDMRNRSDSANNAITSGIIYGSNDGTSWTEITTFTNSVSTAGGTWLIDLSGNTDYYKYYKLYISTGGYSSNRSCGLAEVSITATERTAEESTSSDYDFYVDTDEYKVVKDNNTYKAFNV